MCEGSHYFTDKSQSLTQDTLLMCKDIPVYNITKDLVLNTDLLPGAMKYKTMDYSSWMKTRYSAGSNVSARRLMLRAFGTDNHNRTLSVTRALSLSDCYWLKQQNESVLFNEVTPYLNEEWQGQGIFKGGSIATLFANGAADKRWINSNTLIKYKSFKEVEAYDLCSALGLSHYASLVKRSDEGILVINFTSLDYFLESLEQSGFVGDTDDARYKAVELFKEQAVALFVLDYLVEHDDRHWGNLGFLRDANTGDYVKMAPFYDFDWAWSDGVVPLPTNAIQNYKAYILTLCKQAKNVSNDFNHYGIIKKRADELIQMLE